MGHSLQMNILRTGQTEVGGSMMNQVKQTVGGRRNWWWIQEWCPDSEDDSNDVVLAFITSDEEYVHTSGQLQHAQDEQ